MICDKIKQNGMRECNCVFEWVLGNQIEDGVRDARMQLFLWVGFRKPNWRRTSFSFARGNTCSHRNWCRQFVNSILKLEESEEYTPTPPIFYSGLRTDSDFKVSFVPNYVPPGHFQMGLFHLCLQPPLLLRHPHKNNQQLRLSGSHPYMTFTMPFLICTCVYFD